MQSRNLKSILQVAVKSSGTVASSPMTMINSFWRRDLFRQERVRLRSRAKTQRRVQLVTHPHASTRASVFGTRRPYQGRFTVSPVLVAMDISGPKHEWESALANSGSHHTFNSSSIPAPDFRFVHRRRASFIQLLSPVREPPRHVPPE